MHTSEEYTCLQQEISVLQEALKKLSKKQDVQYTDIMLLLRKIEDLHVTPSDDTVEPSEELYEKVKAIVVADQKASTSYIQRRLRIGYSLSAMLMDRLEEEGIIGPQNGTKPREIFRKE